jgi:hypothetical protein
MTVLTIHTYVLKFTGSRSPFVHISIQLHGCHGVSNKECRSMMQACGGCTCDLVGIFHFHDDIRDTVCV